MTIAPYARRQARRLTAVLLADALSFAAFMLLVGQGLHTERNVLVGAVYASTGVMGVVALKLGAAGLFEWRARRVSRPVSRPYLAGFAVLSSLAIAGTLVGAGMNLAALVNSLVRR